MKNWLAVALIGVLVVAACTKRRTPPTAPAPPATPGLATVWMLAGNVFVPRDTTISHGDTVLWVNASAMSHTTTSGACAPCVADGVWNSGTMSPGATFRVVFGPGTDQPGLVHVDSTGAFPYYCIPHQPTMAGSITVMP
jgi:plastocyanin